jgi:DNA-binding transcriptional ArsR family regulator
MSRPAISQHLKVLKDAQLVAVRSEGRARVYGLNPLPLHALFDWSALLRGSAALLEVDDGWLDRPANWPG